ncbi:hypothetical protein TetV_376 [Tetraselmis virus 1]|uniref:Uncharacterized protein n=1 Tax=Tetraselmis virus 1 TaxID=2060617 RepID=A0A2P0VNI4_9VIRU|nr:hypothetical protein QJ968_gp376 [Tetraselmis virus 1]AUF82468.1 hypothetical protein TetV_376 [Tetraselmis virus 1]
MAAVIDCKDVQRVEGNIRVGESRKLNTGTVRRYITTSNGRDILIQLPTCYTPSGILHDFDEGAKLDMITVNPEGAKQLSLFLTFCEKICDRIARESDRLISVPGTADDKDGSLHVHAPRLRDVRVFEAEDLPADECRVMPGDTVTAIVSPEYIWIGSKRCGLNVRLVQLLLHTDRGRYRSFMFNGYSSPPPPPSASASSSAPPPPPLPPSTSKRPPPPPPMPSRKAKEPEPVKKSGFRPSVMEIVTAKNLLRKTRHQ